VVRNDSNPLLTLFDPFLIPQFFATRSSNTIEWFGFCFTYPFQLISRPDGGGRRSIKLHTALIHRLKGMKVGSRTQNRLISPSHQFLLLILLLHELMRDIPRCIERGCAFIWYRHVHFACFWGARSVAFTNTVTMRAWIIILKTYTHVYRGSRG
jgi:hypothetical protein